MDVAGRPQDVACRSHRDRLEALPAIAQQRALVIRKEQFRSVAVATDRKVKHVQLDGRPPIGPHLGVDAGLVVRQGPS